MSKIVQFPGKNVETDGKTGITVYYSGYYITGYITDSEQYNGELVFKIDHPVMVLLPLTQRHVFLPPVWLNLFHLPAYSICVPDEIDKLLNQNPKHS